MMNGEQAWNQKQSIVFAVDQEPFDDSGKWFCFLYPLMTMEGERLEALAADFPNTGRVWWMIGDQKLTHAVPGAIWCGPIEEHPGWAKSKDNPRHNRFQARKDAIRQGGNDLVELISFSHIEPTPSMIYKGVEVPMSRPPTSIVFLCGKESVLGPVRACWDPERMSATFEAITIRAYDAEHPMFLQTPIEEFHKHVRVESFEFEARQLDYASSPTPFHIRLTRRPWIQFEPLFDVSVAYDGLRDNELINWAVKTFEELHLSRQDKRLLNRFLEQMQQIQSPSFEGVFERRVRRLETISEDVRRIQGLGPEVAALLGKSVFQELVTEHVDVLVEERVAKEVGRRKQEIEASVREERRLLEQTIAQHDKQKSTLKKELRAIQVDHDKQLQGQREELASQHKALEDARALLDTTRERFTTDSEVLFKQWLELFPLVSQTGVGAVNVNVPSSRLTDVLPSSPATATSSQLQLPAFLTHKRGDNEAQALTEEEFLAQFARVVADDGFLFGEDDLCNFHVCIKTGYLTILAGRTGMGKSSLPRLYAKALGCSDEFLHLSVRPDWLDDRDLLGAFNAIARRFEPAPSGFTEQLICAQKDWAEERGGIYLICLDEMNLARVEHYFAQFLSILEKPARQRVIHLFGNGLVDHTDPYAPYRTIRLRDNIRFIGTVNIDETAFFFSPKVLDRSEVVVFQNPNLETPLPDQSGVSAPIVPISLSTFQKWQRSASEAESARPFLLEIDRILRRSRMGFGFRQFDRMLTYIASAQGVMEHDKAIDFQLMQVVLPHMRRMAPRFIETLEALIETVDERRFPRSAEMLLRMRESDAEDGFFQLI
jgi:energy-coupling factor transporter ATP-binding protein EcfA2